MSETEGERGGVGDQGLSFPNWVVFCENIFKTPSLQALKACVTCHAQSCPVERKCKQEETIYQLTVTHKNSSTGNQETYKYVGLAATSFYKRHQNHKTSYKDQNHRTNNELSKHIWDLKDHLWLFMENYWQSLKVSPVSKVCNLCTLERFYHICISDLHTLNEYKEFGDECLHKRFLKLSKFKCKLSGVNLKKTCWAGCRSRPFPMKLHQ